DDVLVVGAVEDPDLTALRAGHVHAPEVVVCELGRGRLLERDDPAALWIDAREDALDRPVLAGGVEALQDEQQAALGLGVEPVVEQRELVDELRELFLALGLPG